jgi:hypothetical protein
MDSRMRTMGPSRKEKPISTASTMANRITFRRKVMALAEALRSG